VVICMEQGADLHMAQLMPLPLTVSCFSKIQIGFTFLVPAPRVVPEKGPLNECVSVHAEICHLFTAQCYASEVLDMGLCLSLCICLSEVGVLLKRLNRGAHKQHHTVTLVF